MAGRIRELRGVCWANVGACYLKMVSFEVSEHLVGGLRRGGDVEVGRRRRRRADSCSFFDSTPFRSQGENKEAVEACTECRFTEIRRTLHHPLSEPSSR